MPLGIAVWGIGAHAQRMVLPAIAASADVRLVGIHTRNRRVLQRCADSAGCLAWYDPEQMLDNPDVDVVYLATPTSLHAVHGGLILSKGKHLWCEKPLATNLADAEALIEQAKAHDLSLAVVCGPRYHPQFFAVQDQLNNGAIGKPTQIKASFHFPHVAPDNFRYNPDLGGGALLDIGFYLLTVVDALFPERLTHLNCEMEQEDGYRVDTSGRAQLHFDDGLIADLSWGYGSAYQNSLQVMGTAGQLVAEPFFSKPQNLLPFINVQFQNGLKQIIAFKNKKQFVEMFKAVSYGVANIDTRLKLISDAGRSQRLINAAMKSAHNQMKDVFVP